MSAPWFCAYCLLGLCDQCPGRLTVHRRGHPPRDVPCGHKHPARGPVARVLAQAYGRVVE